MIKTAMSFALGCALFLQLPSLPSLYWLCGLLLCIPLFIFKPLRWLALILIGAAWTFVVSYHTLSDWLPAEEAGKVHVLTGVISSVPEQRNQRITFRFNPDKANTDVLSSTIRLNWYRPLPTKITAGERWQLTVKLKQPHGLSNPGGFDYERWLFQQKITATGYVINTPSNKRLSEAPFYSINALRQLIANHIAQRIPNSHYTGLIQGLTTGLKSEISHEQWQVLRGTGISHLLAISGLHIGLMAAIGFWLCKTIWSFRSANLLLIPAHHAGAIGGFILAFIYAALAGFALPTQRALIMLAVLLAAILIKRSLSPSHILATSMLLILIYDPVSILSAGFWLSFSAVAIILFITQGRYPAPKYYWLKIHIVLAFSLSPLLFLFFQKASLIAPIANIIAVPFISLIIVPLVLFATCFLFYFPDISRLLFELADMLIHYFWLVMSWFAHFPFSEISITSLAWYYWIVVIIGITLLISPRGFPVKWLGLIGLLPLLYVKTDRPDTHEF